MKSFLFALVVFGFTAQANADLECNAKKGKFNMLLECPDGRTGVVDKFMPTDDIISVNYKVEFKNSPPKNIVIPGNDLKDLIKSQYEKHGSYPQWEKLVPYLNKKWKTKLTAKDLDKVYPQAAVVSPSIKLYDGLVEDGWTYVPKEPRGSGSYKVKAVPIKAKSNASGSQPQQRKGPGKVRAAQ